VEQLLSLFVQRAIRIQAEDGGAPGDGPAPGGTTPTSRRAIDSLSTVTADESHVGDSCTICFEEFEAGSSELLALPCDHFFCKTCILPWLEKTNSCPVCRHELEAEATPGAPHLMHPLGQASAARRLLSTSAFAVRCLNPRVVAVWLRLQCNSARPAARQASAAADVRRGRQSSCDGENWRPSRWRSGHAGGGAGPRRAGRDHNLPYGRRTTATYACCRHRTSTPQHSTTHTRSRAHRTRYVCSKDSSLCDLSLYSRARRLAALTLSITWYCMLI
jgi:hypothetical protein